MFLQIENSEDGEQSCNSQSGILCSTFNLLTYLYLPWELHVSLKCRIKEDNEKKLMFLHFLNGVRGKEI
jgi:hypothetical protein